MCVEVINNVFYSPRCVGQAKETHKLAMSGQSFRACRTLQDGLLKGIRWQILPNTRSQVKLHHLPRFLAQKYDTLVESERRNFGRAPPVSHFRHNPTPFLRNQNLADIQRIRDHPSLPIHHFHGPLRGQKHSIVTHHELAPVQHLAAPKLHACIDPRILAGIVPTETMDHSISRVAKEYVEYAAVYYGPDSGAYIRDWRVRWVAPLICSRIVNCHAGIDLVPKGAHANKEHFEVRDAVHEELQVEPAEIDSSKWWVGQHADGVAQEIGHDQCLWVRGVVDRGRFELILREGIHWCAHQTAIHRRHTIHAPFVLESVPSSRLQV